MMNTRTTSTQSVLARTLPLILTLCAPPAAAAEPVRIALDAGPVDVLRYLTQLLRPSTAPANRVCSAGSDDTGTVLETVASEGSSVYWVRVRFDSGGCNGKEGWVSSDVLRTQ